MKKPTPLFIARFQDGEYGRGEFYTTNKLQAKKWLVHRCIENRGSLSEADQEKLLLLVVQSRGCVPKMFDWVNDLWVESGVVNKHPFSIDATTLNDPDVPITPNEIVDWAKRLLMMRNTEATRRSRHE